jgi:hypothetical protein
VELGAGHGKQMICITRYPVLFTLAAGVEPGINTTENALQSVVSVGISNDTNKAKTMKFVHQPNYLPSLFTLSI